MTRRHSFESQPFRPQPPTPRERPAPAALVARSFSSEELFEGATEIGIVHEGALYRLKITRQGKLILNK